MQRLFRLIPFLSLLIIPIFAPGNAEAVGDLPMEGGSGGGPFRAECPAGQYLLGVSVGSGAWIERIAPLCAPFLPEGVFGTRAPLSFHGGPGGGPQQTFCLNNWFVSGIMFGFTREGNDPKFL